MSEFMQDLDSMLTAAYADGREDERAEWVPVLMALQVHHDWSIENIAGYSEQGDERVAYRATAQALTKAGVTK
jgi:hypothetical protein